MILNDPHYQLADNLNTAEKELNDYTFKLVPIGGLFASYFSDKYRDINDSQVFYSILLPIKLFFSSIKKNILFVEMRDKHSSLFITKLNNKEHISNLIDPIAKHFSNDTLIISANKEKYENAIFFDDFPALNILETCRTFINALILFPKIKYILEKNNISFNKINVFNLLFLQLLRLHTWINVFKTTPPNLVLFDFDRNIRTSPIALAAKKFNIKSITLVHGVINPPYGFTPILVDEIWCWGNMQKRLLVQMNVDEKNIRVVGNPIAHSQLKNKINTEESKNKLGIASQKIVLGLAINPIGDAYNMQLIQLVSDALKLLKNNAFIILLKLHPSQSHTKYEKLCATFQDLIVFKNILYTNTVFFQTCDFALMHNSGIGYEAICNGVPVGVLNNIALPLGNGEIMIEHGKCPEFKNATDLFMFMEHFAEERSDLLKVQQDFVRNEYYYKIGSEATEEIIYNINTFLKVAS